MSDATVDTANKKGAETRRKRAYDPPVLRAVGNLNDVVAGTTQTLLCDGGNFASDGDHDVNGMGQC